MAEGDPVESKSWLDRHLWQIQPLRDIGVIAGVLFLFWLGYILSIVTVPLLLAITFAYLFEPVIRRLTKISWVSRQGAAAFIIGSSAFVIVVPLAVGGTFAAVQGVGLAANIAEDGQSLRAAIQEENRDDEFIQARVSPGLWSWVRDTIHREQDLQAQRLLEQQEAQAEADARNAAADEAAPPTDADAESAEPVQESASTDPAESREAPARRAIVIDEPSDVEKAVGIAIQFVEANASAITARAFRTGAGAFETLVNTVTSIGYLGFTLFLAGFFFFFASTGYGKVLAFGESLIPDAHRELTLHLLKQFDAVIAGFIRGRLTIAFLQSIVFTLAYWAIGVPAPILLGVGVAVLSIVPYAALVGIPISIVLLWIEGYTGFRGDIWWVLGAPLAVYFIGQALDDYVWTPLIQGKSTGMDTPTILFATLAGGALLGIYGLLLAIPLAACIKILLKEIFWPRFKQWAHGETPDFLPIAKD